MPVLSHVKEIMQAKRLTMDDFVQRSGMSKRTINKARSDAISECRLSTLIRIAETLNVPLTALFTYTPPLRGEDQSDLGE